MVSSAELESFDHASKNLRSVEGNVKFMLTFAWSLCIELGPKLINGILRSLLLLPRHFG